MVDLLDLWFFAILLFVALVVAREFGGWLHRRVAGTTDGDPEDGTDKSFLITATLGLLALLTAFTFSLALDRYEERRMIVVEEANDIGTAEMRVRLLNAPDNARLAGLLQAYARTRLKYGLSTAADKPLLAARSSAQRTEIQAATLTALGPEARSPMATYMLPPINAVLDIGVEREALNESRIPGAILFSLIAYNLLTAAMLGYALTGARARQRPATIVLFVLLTLAITLILDLDRPQRGTIRVDQTPMKQLVAGFAPVPASAPQPSLR
jgi:hypothetical protein